VPPLCQKQKKLRTHVNDGVQLHVRFMKHKKRYSPLHKFLTITSLTVHAENNKINKIILIINDKIFMSRSELKDFIL
jgi:hypothetical protein